MNAIKKKEKKTLPPPVFGLPSRKVRMCAGGVTAPSSSPKEADAPHSAHS